MALDFPASPTVGQVYPTSVTAGLPQYVWDGQTWTLKGSTSSDYVFRAGDAMTGNLTPSVNGAVNLGSQTLRWGTVYTSDLSLSNGIGDWTIVEGEDDLFLYNNKRSRTYKFALVEVDPFSVNVPAKKI